MENYRLLADAVIIQAANDYRKCLCKEHELKSKNELSGPEIIELKKIESEIKDLKRFFLGEDILLYTNLSGRMIMDRLTQEVIEFNYDISMLDKRYNNRSSIPEE